MVLATGKRRSSATPGAVESKDDCLHLEKPGSEDEILENLKDRYSRNLTFTNIGSTSCIVINPRKALESFSDATSAKYTEHAKSTASDKTPLPAHIFQLADSAYTRMIREESDQSIVLSGEAGSGKSEARKLLLRQLCALSSKKQSKKSRSNKEANSKSAKLAQNILKAESIMEAFGHAKTESSPNSSRFSRYTEVQFDVKGRLAGCKTLDYLLEKTRVVGKFSAQEERNFHIFYYLLAGCSNEDKEDWQLNDVSSFEYLGSNSSSKNGKSRNVSKFTEEDAIKFGELKENLKALGISKYTQSEIFNLIAAILHLGNLQFEESEQKQEPCKVKNPQVLQFVADLLGVSAQDLETSIVYRTKIIKREMCSVFLSSSESANQRDALAMTIYSLLFSWILEQINSKLVKDEVVNFVGIVDFTGTDQHLKKNGFDRLLSNLANEKLYNFVMKRLIDEDIETLKKEKLVSSMASVSYVSNQMQLDFLLGSPDMGLLSLIDTESARLSGLNELAAPQDSSQTPGRALLGHLIETYPSHPLFHVVTHSTKLSSKKKSVNQDPLFTIKHSAGSVEYDASSFLETNLDQLYSDFVILVNGDGKRGIGSTENEFLRELFSEDVVYTRKHWKDSSVLVGASTSKKPLRTPSISRKRRSSVTVEKETLLERDVLVPSLWSSFQSALDELILSIEGTTSWYAFTLSPNSDSSSATAGFAHDRFDPLHVQAQIGRLALAEIAEARRECHDYIISMELADFLERFKLVVKPVISRSIHPSQGDEARVKDFCEKSGWKEADYAIGSKTGAIYLAEGAYRSLTDELKEITERMKLEEKEARRNGTGKRRSASQEDGDDSQSVAGSDFESDYEGSVYESDLSSESATIENKKENRRYFSMRNVNQKPPALLSASSSGGGNFKDSSSAAPAKVNVDKIDPPAKKPLSAARKRWLCLTWSITWWSFPFLLSWIGGMKRADIRMAWREKFTICVLIFLACCSLLAFIILPGYFICPTVQMISTVELEGFNQPSPFIGYTAGRVFHLDSLRDNHILNSYSNVQQYSFSPFYGQDLSAMFYPAQNWANYCPNIAQPIGPSNSTWDNIAQRPTFYAGWYPHQVVINGTAKPYLENLFQYSIARVAWDMTYLTKISSNSRRLLVISGNVYDVSSYFNIQNGVFGQDVKSFFSTGLASNVPDATGKWKELVTSGKLTQDQSNDILNCMKHIFYVGVVDTRNTAACKLSNYTLLAASIFICAIIFVKFLAALRFGQTKLPENHDKFVILQMPCYTEGPDSLQKSLESLAAMRYDDKRKLLFVICDGMVVGSGNNRPTPRIVLDILGVDPNLDPEPFNFQSLGDGDKQHNMGKVYSGLYEVQGHSVPYIVVVKVGKPSERQKPGNRGKRDSQMILMRFLSRVHFNSPMAPLELEIYRHLKYIIGVNPSFYEYILMVDADTEVHVDALNRMISCMIHDSKIMGLCGETLLSNQNDSIITMIQVYEYFISHHLAKAFESLFGTVTCLPGCFSMYRIRTPNKNVPLIIAPPIITDYSENSVETLHLKNLLHLGEDRYLTTLMMKHFPDLKLSFTADATCETNAPDRWGILKSQRRRWINSTVHNLFELMSLNQLCGFCCFSMRFIVFMDLFSTVVQPAGVLYLGYLFYKLSTADYLLANDSTRIPVLTIALIAGVYGLQVIIFAIRQKWAQIGWMIVYLLATPIFAFYIPVYSFWCMDDFSWGNTRIVLGENGKVTAHAADVQPFDPSIITLKKWGEFEQELAQKTEGRHSPVQSEAGSSYSKVKKASSVYSNSAYGQGSVVPFAGAVAVDLGTGRPASVYNGSTYAPYGYSNVPLQQFSNNGPSNRMSMVSIRPGFSSYPAIGNMMSPVNRFSLQAPTPQQPYTVKNASTSGSAGQQQHQLPADEDLLTAIKKILSTANLLTVTKKMVRDELSLIFQTDLSDKKALINTYIEDVLQGRR